VSWLAVVCSRAAKALRAPDGLLLLKCYRTRASNYLLTGDASETFPLGRERHSINSSARATVEAAAMHPPAISIKSKPPKFKIQITLAIEPMHMATISTEETICLMIAPNPDLPRWGEQTKTSCFFAPMHSS
jgi:hypothetical protein